MLLPSSTTHNKIVLRPPPGTRFTIWGHDVHIEFQKGREREIVEWLLDWIDSYIEPEAKRLEALKSPNVQGIFPKPLSNELKTELKRKINLTEQVKLELEKLNQIANEVKSSIGEPEDHGKAE